MASSKFDDIDLHVDSVIKAWAVQNMTKIIRAYTQKGGWEGWAQVEIATALHQTRDSSLYDAAEDALMATLTKTSREQPVYPSTPSAKTGRAVQTLADVVIESGPPLRREFVIIELKCEGFYNKKDFVQRVQDDITKLNGDIVDAFKPAKAWALAISTSQEVYDEMRTRWPAADHIVLYPPLSGNGGARLTPHEESMNPRIVLWVFEKEILKR